MLTETVPLAELLLADAGYLDIASDVAAKTSTRDVMEFTRRLSPRDRLAADVHEYTNSDCIEGLYERAETRGESIDLIVTSIPFEELFTYSGKIQDVGNNGSTVDIREGRFALNMRFFVEAAYRAMRPGCNVCIHIQQLLAYLNQHGFIGRRDFRGAIIDIFRAGGFDFYAEVAIPKNPQIMAQRLNLKSLQFIQGYQRDSVAWGPAVNDYVLIFKKPGENPNPVRCMIDRRRDDEGGWVTAEEWIKWASGVWHDIQEIDVLDGWRAARESDEEKHVCPLQLEVIRRLLLIYSNPVTIQPDVCVCDPFMGIWSTGYVAQACGRNSLGWELKESYFDQGQRNAKLCRARLKEAAKHGQRELFGDDAK